MSNRFTIIKDTREKAPHGWSFDPDAYCDGTTISKVSAGDYTIEGLEEFICVERKKTVDEFARNCIEARWKNCMQRMSACRHSFILFEFSWDDINNYPASAKVPNRIKKKLRVTPALIRKVVHQARDEYGIHVLACDNKLKAEKVAYRILKKAYDLQLRR